MLAQFSTKGQTLSLLQGIIKSACVAPIALFTVKDWRDDKERCLEQIKNISHGVPSWIVRSSCKSEDTIVSSQAGRFESICNVTDKELKNSIESVICSYGVVSDDDEILVQPMLSDVIRSGVAFSHDPNTFAPYRVVNWSEGSNTTFVTSGAGGNTWQSAALSPYLPPKKFAQIVTLLEELLEIFGGVPIDCEFAVTERDGPEILWLLQARPLVLLEVPQTPREQEERLDQIFQKVSQGMGPHPLLMGHRTVYGVMPDWNPAEIIGIRPRPLALSLYRDLVTDSIWAYQRHNYGYRNLRSFPLMKHFFGLPYIDVRVSFNSFIPAGLSEEIADRLVDYYIDRLLEEPSLHDKVEFEIIFSCYTLDLDVRLKQLSPAGFTRHDRNEIANHLRVITNKILHPEDGLWRQDARKIDALSSRRGVIMSSHLSSLEKVYWLLEDVKRYGTLPFAGLARAGFVAVQMLKSLVAMEIFTVEDFDLFMAGLSTVGSQLPFDRANFAKHDFLIKYGHLRPGTYEITSPRYDEASESYFDWSQSQLIGLIQKTPFVPTADHLNKVAKLLSQTGLETNPQSFFEFIRSAIELRESSKFNFTRNLSDALVLLGEYGSQFDISADDLSFVKISTLKDIYINAINPKEILLDSINAGRAEYRDTARISLPPLIVDPSDVWSFQWQDSKPNFVTQLDVSAQVISLPANNTEFEGAIVCIPNADPGYDWLFSRKIAGLITAYGGVNSHMAIRAGELGLPAVIGAGEVLYRQWSSAKRLHIDCAGRRVNVLI
jgi:phosphohistidine swiveling domain-containing protein